MIDKLHNIFC